MAQLFTREMNIAISRGRRNLKVIPLQGALKVEISHWLFLETWDEPLPWREERHVSVRVATDASMSGWGFYILGGDSPQQVSDYWSSEEQNLDISTKEALVIEKMLQLCAEKVEQSSGCSGG